MFDNRLCAFVHADITMLQFVARLSSYFICKATEGESGMFKFFIKKRIQQTKNKNHFANMILMKENEKVANIIFDSTKNIMSVNIIKKDLLPFGVKNDAKLG